VRPVIAIADAESLPAPTRAALVALLHGLPHTTNGTDIEVRRYVADRTAPAGRRDLLPDVTRILGSETRRARTERQARQADDRAAEPGLVHRLHGRIDADHVFARARATADKLQARREAVHRVMNGYQGRNVTDDEIRRTLDLLWNLNNNRDYFGAKTGLIKAYTPSNQPLYAHACFALVPSFLASEVRVRPPRALQPIVARLTEALDLATDFPNVIPSQQDYAAFARTDRHATDAVIFTGTPQTAAEVRGQYPAETLFILNGAGHNPVVVTETAELDQAVRSVLRLCLQGSGMDCAAPNSVLVHASRRDEFLARLLDGLRAIEHRVGKYSDQDNIVGPNHRPAVVTRVAELIKMFATDCVYGGEVNHATGLIKPLVFMRPLIRGPWLEEFFGPVVMVQPYKSDPSLSRYFEHPDYAPNAMYVSVFGRSPYVESLIGRGLHTPENILFDTDLHEVERGWLPYGGLGPNASAVFVNGECIPGATLPQRDVFRYLIEPLLEASASC
jgi:lysyl-tRNA synthetase class 1